MDNLIFTGGKVAKSRNEAKVTQAAAARIVANGVTYQSVLEPKLGNYNQLVWVWHCSNGNRSWRSEELPSEVQTFWDFLDKHGSDLEKAMAAINSEITVLRLLLSGAVATSDMMTKLKAAKWLNADQKRDLAELLAKLAK
jgi:hypothetical protein